MSSLLPKKTSSIQRQFAITILGVTGFTGSYVFQYFLDYGLQKFTGNLCLAGRNEQKLLKLLERVYKKENIQMINKRILFKTVDVNDDQSLLNLCQSSHVLINCVGPFIQTGPNVVKSCILGGCNYVDITGEPNFIYSSYLKFNDLAKVNHISIVHSCGFDSVPADIGLLYTLNCCPEHGMVCNVESHLSLNSSHNIKAHHTTFDTILESLSNIKYFNSLRKTLVRNMPTILRYPHSSPPKSKWLIFKNNVDHRYSTKFPGSDASVVRLSQYIETIRTPQQYQPYYSAYMGTQSLFNMILILFVGLIITVLVKIGLKNCVKRYPSFFTLGMFSDAGPSPSDMQDVTSEFIFKAEGYGMEDKEVKDITNQTKPDMVYRTRVQGPEPGYIFTSALVSEAALTLFNERQKILPGVLTPSTAFRQTSYISRLQNSPASISFDLLD